jgi:hypothetical protein
MNRPGITIELGQSKLRQVNRVIAVVERQQSDPFSPQSFAEKLLETEYRVFRKFEIDF